jgi:hypothetical protein
MPYRVVRFEPTPNPNALKCVVEPSPGTIPRSYFNADQAVQAGDGLAVALFGIEGITNLLIHASFITVSRRPDAPWGAIRTRVRAVLAEAG